MVQLSQKAIEAIEDIIKRGNDAEVRRRGDSCVVIEIKKKIQYGAPRIGAEQGQ